jgi:hypothetical protein
MPRARYSQIAEGHHVARRCGYQVIERDVNTNEVVGLYPTAMRLRQNIRETYLSINWLEHCNGTKIERLKVILAIHRAKAKGRLSPQSGIAVLNIGRVREIGTAHGRNLAVRHTPSRDDPSYSRISGLPLDNADDLLIAGLADEASSDFILVGEIDAQP